MAKIKEDLTGRSFGRLTVTARAFINNPNGESRWVCICICGNINTVRRCDLTGNRTKSCGCLNNELCGLLGKKSRKPDGVSGFNALYNQYKAGASYRNLIFNLTKDEFKLLTSSDCYYCGNKPIQKSTVDNKEHSIYLYNGIDRKDNNIGYELFNCVPACKRCNFLKNNIHHDEFINIIFKICKHMKDANENTST